MISNHDHEQGNENHKLEAIKAIPDTTNLDNALTAAKIITGIIPLAGSTLSELLNKSVSTYTNARITKWQKAVAEGFEELYRRYNNLPQDILTNDRFATSFLHGTLAATRTHQEEKLEALRNAVLNSGLPTAPDDDLQLMFLNFVDSFTPWHLTLLSFFENPLQWFQRKEQDVPNYYATSAGQVMLNAFPELKDRREFYTQVCKDLNDRGLADLSSSSLNALGSGQGALNPRISPMGSQFLQFIRFPTL